ncbi:hypothetical protein PISL3812_05112 [Talaromyces islandicus]|uniref:Altered inheritance of mitochondria protein 9, mitochondrial n=1 Tax=Talaromyces islandicus TaxID=28573 RepID=A0A0U1LXR7_TALIS|nr:hypothetical protein PISL3812_05112 [Talaromyces islandicus]
MLPLMRNLRKFRRNQQIAQMSVVCRGKSITRDELFTYTNGRFLVDEDRQFARRYRKFNLDAVCDIVAAAGGSTSRIIAIEKFEGGFSKALLMKKEDGIELIAKVLCRIAGPAFLTTASEVDTLEYVRNYTSVPVPRVLSWSPHNSNTVGAEYVIMEKAMGIPLFERWGKMAEIEKLGLIKSLAQLEAQLNVNEQHRICIGPSPERSFGVDAAADLPNGNESTNNGPYLGVSIAKQELSRITSQSTGNQPMGHRGSPKEQIHLLEIAISLMGMLDSHPVLNQFARPTLWHTDLHMGNIYVAPDNNSRITAPIDVQTLSVLPVFLQARWPVFLQPPREYTRDLVQPVLPDDFDSLDEEDKVAALHDWTQAKMAKAYEVSTFLENNLAHNAMNVPRVFRELFIRIGEISDVGIVPLRECLIEIFQNWSNLDIPGHCPYSFSQEDICAHEQQFASKGKTRSYYRCILREWRGKNRQKKRDGCGPFQNNR